MTIDSKKGVLGIGSLVVDTIAHVDDAFLEKLALQKGSVTYASKEEFALLRKALNHAVMRPGGSSANVCRGLARLGWPVSFVGKVGDDALGRWLLNHMEVEGLAIFPLFAREATAEVLCLVTPDGERTMRDCLGAAGQLQAQEVKREVFLGRRHLHIEGYSLLLEGVTAKAMALAKETNVTISFDLANYKIVEAYPRLIEQLLEKYVAIIFANGAEATALTGLRPEGACRRLAELCKVGVVTVHAEGCYVCSGTTLTHIPAQQVTHVVDTTGAGDLFASGFLDGWLRGLPLATAAAQGHLLAAAVIQQEGALLSEASWHRLLAMLAK